MARLVRRFFSTGVNTAVSHSSETQRAARAASAPTTPHQPVTAMKKLLIIAVSLATTLVAATSAEGRDRGYGRHSQGHRHGGYSAPRYCAPRPYCPPPRVYYAPRYCAPRPVCPPRYGYGYGYGRPSVQLSYGYVGRPGYRW